MTFLEILAIPGSPRTMRRKGWAPHVRIKWDPETGWQAASDYSPIFAPLSGAYVHLISPEDLSANDWEVLDP